MKLKLDDWFKSYGPMKYPLGSPLGAAILCITTHTPAVSDVFGSGHNVEALRPARRVGFRSLGPGGQTTFPRDILFLYGLQLLNYCGLDQTVSKANNQ